MYRIENIMNGDGVYSENVKMFDLIKDGLSDVCIVIDGPFPMEEFELTKYLLKTLLLYEGGSIIDDYPILDLILNLSERLNYHVFIDLLQSKVKNSTIYKRRPSSTWTSVLKVSSLYSQLLQYSYYVG